MHTSDFQWFFSRRHISQVTPKIMYFYYLNNPFLDQSIQKNILFDFENRCTGDFVFEIKFNVFGILTIAEL